MQNNKINIKARHRARCLVVQALYQLQFNHTSKEEVLAEFLVDEFSQKADLDYFRELFTGIVDNRQLLDEILTPVLANRSVAELTSIESAVLHMAVYELKYRLDIPYRVVINEALELSKKFGTQEGYKYVNGVLDRLVKTLRAHEN